MLNKCTWYVKSSEVDFVEFRLLFHIHQTFHEHDHKTVDVKVSTWFENFFAKISPTISLMLRLSSGQVETKVLMADLSCLFFLK